MIETPIFVRQFKAARAMSGLTQDELVELSDVSIGTIQKIEAGDGSVTERVKNKLIRAFEGLGIVFTVAGVEYHETNISFLGSFLDVLESVPRTLAKGHEVLIHCADERRNSAEVTAKLAELSQDYKLRFTIERGNTAITTDPANYRWIDPDFFANAEVQVIFADKVITQIKGEKKIFIVIRSTDNARVARRQFEYWWKVGQHVKA